MVQPSAHSGQVRDNPLDVWIAQLNGEVAEALDLCRRRGHGLTVVLSWQPNQPIAGPKMTLYGKGIDSRTK